MPGVRLSTTQIWHHFRCIDLHVCELYQFEEDSSHINLHAFMLESHSVVWTLRIQLWQQFMYIYLHICQLCVLWQEPTSDLNLHPCLHVAVVVVFQELCLDISLFLHVYCVLCSSRVQLWRQLISLPTRVLSVVFFKSPALMSVYIYAYMCVVFFKSPSLTSAYIYIPICVLCSSRVQLWWQLISMPTCVVCTSRVQLWCRLISMSTRVLYVLQESSFDVSIYPCLQINFYVIREFSCGPTESGCMSTRVLCVLCSMYAYMCVVSSLQYLIRVLCVPCSVYPTRVLCVPCSVYPTRVLCVPCSVYPTRVLCVPCSVYAYTCVVCSLQFASYACVVCSLQYICLHVCCMLLTGAHPGHQGDQRRETTLQTQWFLDLLGKLHRASLLSLPSHRQLRRVRVGVGHRPDAREGRLLFRGVPHDSTEQNAVFVDRLADVWGGLLLHPLQDDRLTFALLRPARRCGLSDATEHAGGEMWLRLVLRAAELWARSVVLEALLKLALITINMLQCFCRPPL